MFLGFAARRAEVLVRVQLYGEAPPTEPVQQHVFPTADDDTAAGANLFHSVDMAPCRTGTSARRPVVRPCLQTWIGYIAHQKYCNSHFHHENWHGAAGLGTAQVSSASLAAQQSFASSADIPATAVQDDQQTYPQQSAQPQQQAAQIAAQSHAYLQQNALQKYQAAAQNMPPPEDDMELIMDTGIAFASTYVAPQATNRQGQMDQPPADDDVRPIYCCSYHDACCSDMGCDLCNEAVPPPVRSVSVAVRFDSQDGLCHVTDPPLVALIPHVSCSLWLAALMSAHSLSIY